MLVPYRISLGDKPHLDHNWMHNQIVANPAVLGLEEDLRVVYSDKYKIQHVPGELTMSLAGRSSGTRYYVQLKYGRINDEQIVCLLDGWGHQRQAAPQYGHVAVLVAEEITGSLLIYALKTLGDFIPLIVIELKAYMCEEGIKFVPNMMLRQVE